MVTDLIEDLCVIMERMAMMSWGYGLHMNMVKLS